MASKLPSFLPTLLRRSLGMVFMIALAMLLGLKSISQGQTPPASQALIVYDAPPEEPKMGMAYALMVQALLGHFEMQADVQPVTDYRAGQTERYSTVFYLGSYYNNPLPDDFLRDVAATKKRVVWFKYNLWQLMQPEELGFEQKSGLQFIDLHGLDAAPSAQNPNPGFFDTVLYKGKSLVKYYSYDQDHHQVLADPDIGLVKIADPAKAQARVMIQDSRTKEQAPYIVQGGASGNFWYFADLPLSYIGPRDRYLVFCDILHDILGVHHPETHRALVRLEDVGAKVTFASMKKLTDYLYSKHIPFSVAAFPHYRDPLGAYNDGIAESIAFPQASELWRSLYYALTHGGNLVMHGFTHQYSNVKNPHTGVSADDYEFWNSVTDAPVKEDSVNWALGRLNTGLQEFAKGNYRPWAWETPHYQASPLTYQAMAKRFSTAYQRVVYYTSTTPNLNAEGTQKDYSTGMFFPYIIHRDPYGQTVIPENLGNIEYDISSIDPTSNYNYTWKDILENADDALVVRDGFGSFFFHPFWVEPDFENLHAFEDFKNLIDGITRLGYQWTDAKKLALKANPALGH